jgi:hypothetical protein
MMRLQRGQHETQPQILHGSAPDPLGLPSAEEESGQSPPFLKTLKPVFIPNVAGTLVSAPTSAVSEPGVLVLVGFGLAALAVVRRRRLPGERGSTA